ncbi:LytR/AlgR family response regulator transcription factor [Chryseosolibacter indicus]|uniref:LytTR family DNA-binding domain-containing protein n=1 Tax=Chryseosolibacter indicus TaxID=2782351 RepID=A0ABS5VJU6_9BACT|nr:LytTR family DNA-binding domain-containing protein [Chryseosolibacter indicus]MBT1701702.1 LytTR family DNA-binding domain-containing protein [Chryseosolibacter indicus]
MIRALIVDDESKAINLLKITMERNFPGQFLLETAQGGEDGLNKLNSFKPDLLFLDIEMPSMSGFDLLAAKHDVDCKVIFTTAYNNYAIRAIRYNALDYLLKPISPVELKEAVHRFQEQQSKSEVYQRQLENFFHSQEKNLAITTYDGVVFLEVDKILRCEADMNYTKFFLDGSKTFVSSKTLKEYEDLLTVHSNFLRVHRSHLVNFNYVVKFKHEGLLLLKDTTCVPVSRRKKEDVIKYFSHSK